MLRVSLRQKRDEINMNRKKISGLLATCLLLAAQLGASTTPVVVRSLTLTNQTQAIPTRTLYTVQKTGMYRASVYIVTTGTGSNCEEEWTVYVHWTDEAGQQSGGIATTPCGLLQGNVTLAMRAVAGTQITFETVNSSPSGIYELIIVLEQVV
jgi:hypothetical protein